MDGPWRSRVTSKLVCKHIAYWCILCIYYAVKLTFTCFEPDLKLQSQRVNDWCRLSPAVPFDEWYADQGCNATSQHQQHDNSSRCIPFLGLFRKRQWRDGITPFCAHPWHVCLELTKSIEVPWNTPFTSIRHIFTFSTGEILTFETSLANQVLPSPLSLSFTDSSSTTHFVSGLLQLGEPSDVSDILRSLTCELSELWEALERSSEFIWVEHFTKGDRIIVGTKATTFTGGTMMAVGELAPPP